MAEDASVAETDKDFVQFAEEMMHYVAKKTKQLYKYEPKESLEPFLHAGIKIVINPYLEPNSERFKKLIKKFKENKDYQLLPGVEFKIVAFRLRNDFEPRIRQALDWRATTFLEHCTNLALFGLHSYETGHEDALVNAVKSITCFVKDLYEHCLPDQSIRKIFDREKLMKENVVSGIIL